MGFLKFYIQMLHNENQQASVKDDGKNDRKNSPSSFSVVDAIQLCVFTATFKPSSYHREARAKCK